MSSLEASPRSMPSSADSSPVAANTPGLSNSMSGLSVQLDTATRRKLSFEALSPPPLHMTKEEIGRPDSPPLFAIKGPNANDVCFIGSPTANPHTVFKAGKANAVKAILCSKIAKILDLEACVPTTIEAKAAQVISKEDLDERLNPIVYKKVYIDGEPWLANPSDCYAVHSRNKHSVSLFGGCDFTIEKEDDAYNVVPKTPKAEKHPLAFQEVLFGTLDGEKHVFKRESCIPVTVESHSPQVQRGEVRLALKASKGEDELKNSSDDDLFEPGVQIPEEETEIPDNALLVREEVEGFLQPMIQNIVTEIDGVPVDVVHIPKTRDAFYSMINSISFINSVVLAVLFRTQDGKAHYLRDSNFLFTEEGGKLDITLIDLDETWPCSNGLSEAPHLREKGDIAALRLGLMGYPHAHTPLQGEDKSHYDSIIKKIIDRRELLIGAVAEQKLDNSQRVVQAFTEVLAKMVEFQEKAGEVAVTLADMVFHVFPVYKQHWDELSALDLSKEEIAASIGYVSVAEQKELSARMQASMERNKSKN